MHNSVRIVACFLCVVGSRLNTYAQDMSKLVLECPEKVVVGLPFPVKIGGDLKVVKGAEFFSNVMGYKIVLSGKGKRKISIGAHYPGKLYKDASSGALIFRKAPPVAYRMKDAVRTECVVDLSSMPWRYEVNGRFIGGFQKVPPGRYNISVFEDVCPDDENEPVYVERKYVGSKEVVLLARNRAEEKIVKAVMAPTKNEKTVNIRIDMMPVGFEVKAIDDIPFWFRLMLDYDVCMSGVDPKAISEEGRKQLAFYREIARLSDTSAAAKDLRMDEETALDGPGSFQAEWLYLRWQLGRAQGLEKTKVLEGYLTKRPHLRFKDENMVHPSLMPQYLLIFRSPTDFITEEDLQIEPKN